MAIQFGNDKIKDIYVGSDKIKEVYNGSELVWSSAPAVEPFILFEENKKAMSIAWRYTGSTAEAYAACLYLSAYGDTGSSNRVSVATFFPIVDLTPYKALEIDLSIYSTEGGSSMELGFHQTSNNTSFLNPIMYAYYPGRQTLTIDIGNLTGLLYFKAKVSAANGNINSLTIFKITLK